MRRLRLEQLLEIRTRLLRVSANEVVITDVVQQRGRRRSFRKSLAVMRLRLCAFTLLIEISGYAQVIILAGRDRSNKQEEEKRLGGYSDHQKGDAACHRRGKSWQAV
jgi:hypothetical protein